jgi:hypothetical protein
MLAIQDFQGKKGSSGSRIGRSPNLRRDFESAHIQLVADYFSESPVYNSEMFERGFRMSKELFLKICSEMKAFNPLFEQRKDAISKPGLSPLQKCTA